MRAGTRAASWVVLAVAIAAFLAPIEAGARSGGRRTVTKTYVTGDGGPWMSTAVCAPEWGFGVGAVCLGAVEKGQVSLRIEDESGRRVGAEAVITDGNGVILSKYSFCGRSGPIAMRRGVLFVHLDGPDSYEPRCPLTEFGYATIGQVHATFIDE